MERISFSFLQRGEKLVPERFTKTTVRYSAIHLHKLEALIVCLVDPLYYGSMEFQAIIPSVYGNAEINKLSQCLERDRLKLQYCQMVFLINEIIGLAMRAATSERECMVNI
ncbi:hypothetical protein Tcan_09849 [Toxocara canis]|uniref:Uncharacterized protein n=1 Tax=Toxocara canis TaxID=6265 RepID=A0A0B2VIB0_TOXCA|nr:hypothetical protein Tcan_09849 [Toxocara canis]